MEGEGEYLLEGFVDMYGLGAFAHVAAGHEDFHVVLSKDNTVVNTVPFWLSGSEVHDKIPFNRKFKSPPFDSFVFFYRLGLEG